MCGIEICESLLPMISLQIATKTDKMYNCIYRLFFVMHLKIVKKKNLPQNITTMSIDSCNGQYFL